MTLYQMMYQNFAVFSGFNTYLGASLIPQEACGQRKEKKPFIFSCSCASESSRKEDEKEKERVWQKKLFLNVSHAQRDQMGRFFSIFGYLQQLNFAQ